MSLLRFNCIPYSGPSPPSTGEFPVFRRPSYIKGSPSTKGQSVDLFALSHR